MLRNSPATPLDRFRYTSYEQTADILITTCPKTIFTVNPDLNQVVENVLVVFRDNRWHLVDGELYRDRDFVKGLLRADFYDCVDIKGNHFLLISTYPLTCDTTSWRESVLDVIDIARENWITMRKLEMVMRLTLGRAFHVIRAGRISLWKILCWMPLAGMLSLLIT